MLPYIAGTFTALSAINNSKVGLRLLYIENSKNSFFNSSIFVKSKLDYFDGSIANWWRWKPGFGVELDFVAGKKYFVGGFHGDGVFQLKKSYGISLELGLEKPIDFGVANPQSHKLTPYVNFILMKGF